MSGNTSQFCTTTNHGVERDHLLLPYFRAKKNICKIYGKSSMLKFYKSNTYLHIPSAKSSLFTLLLV